MENGHASWKDQGWLQNFRAGIENGVAIPSGRTISQNHL